MINYLFYILTSVMIKVPKFIYVKTIDIYNYYRYKEWENFEGFGLHIYVGLFGRGKTISMVEHAYRLAKKFPQLTVYTNIKLQNFPEHTTIIPLENYQQIIDAPGDSLFVIDEISSIFQSRSWSKFPPALMGQLLQVRKRKKMVLGTAQRFHHVDKLIRDITFNVIQCSCIARRWVFQRYYEAYDVEVENEMRPAPIKWRYNFIQTDFIRNLYDTAELIDDMKKQEFISNEEAINRQGGGSTVISVGEVKKKKKMFGK
ncbi:hypothetical protein R9X47_21735 [Wukongibacter baidiensis]|uniref:zonular occludens toxin domain-containing protein n=1 Tax=Wukongibacter baidiensis TaxID=1723361 RepID=UPI003D7F62DF